MSIYQLERNEDVDELGRLLANSESPAVRRRAALALGEIVEPDDDAASGLVEVARDDPERAVRAGAVDALDDLGEPALRRLFATGRPSGEGPVADPPVEDYVDSLGHDLPSMRRAAAAAIGSVGATDAVDQVIPCLGDPDPKVRERVVRTLGQLGDADAVGPLADMAADAPPRLRAGIATALGEIGHEAGLESLFALAEDDEAAVRRRAVEALGRFGRERSVTRLVDRLDDDVGSVRRAAVFSIVESLSNAPAAGSHDLRTAIVDGLTTSHGAVVTDALVELFEESTEAHRRRNATWLLGRVSAERSVAVETLVTALGDDDEMVRQFAATSLTQMEDAVVEDALLDALDGSSGDRRSMIVFTLGTVGTERSRQRLVALLDETEDVDFQERVLSALSKLGGSRA